MDSGQRFAVRLRNPGDDKAWRWVGSDFTVTTDPAEAFTYPAAYMHVAEEVAGRARSAGLEAQVAPVKAGAKPVAVTVAVTVARPAECGRTSPGRRAAPRRRAALRGSGGGYSLQEAAAVT
jgi:hypothetical protein